MFKMVLSVCLYVFVLFAFIFGIQRFYDNGGVRNISRLFQFLLFLLSYYTLDD